MKHPATVASPNCRKIPTGIIGRDDIAGGGLPSWRPTLVCANAWCQKKMSQIAHIWLGLDLRLKKGDDGA